MYSNMNRSSMDTSTYNSKDSHESVYERYASLIPKFPKQNINDLEQLTSKDTISSFEEERFQFLQNWIFEIYSKQSIEDKEYRTILRKFLTN